MDDRKADNSRQSKRRRANALDGKTWTRYSISVWSDIKKTSEEVALKHPAIFPIALAQRVIQCFMSPDDEVVLDPFVGVGSTVLAAEIEDKTGIGIELSSEFAAVARSRLHDQPSLFRDEVRAKIIEDDARNLLQHVGKCSVDLIVTSPVGSQNSSQPPCRHGPGRAVDFWGCQRSSCRHVLLPTLAVPLSPLCAPRPSVAVRP
ncbi:MAG TPA: class I SAM-dependent methyltransferase [Anaerolineae bacterium]|nr:class I SAM-dependent methyltransferase [Anaerolineae bacterium]